MTKLSVPCRGLEIVTLAPGESYDLASEDFVELVKRKRLVAVQGWLFRDRTNFNKHSDSIRRLFTPLEEFESNVARLVNRAREACDVLVGVHIRHGDYKKSFNGRYFYEVAEYLDIMERVENLFPGKEVAFLVCSNVTHDVRRFSAFRVTLGNHHLIEDMYYLARCDYILGPPSTYSMWASFYGKVPLYSIVDPDAAISLRKFNVVVE